MVWHVTPFVKSAPPSRRPDANIRALVTLAFAQHKAFDGQLPRRSKSTGSTRSDGSALTTAHRRHCDRGDVAALEPPSERNRPQAAAPARLDRGESDRRYALRDERSAIRALRGAPARVPRCSCRRECRSGQSSASGCRVCAEKQHPANGGGNFRFGRLRCLQLRRSRAGPARPGCADLVALGEQRIRGPCWLPLVVLTERLPGPGVLSLMSGEGSSVAQIAPRLDRRAAAVVG